MLRPSIALALSSVLFAGCAAEWSRPNTTQAESGKDRDQCQQQSVANFPQRIVQQKIVVVSSNSALASCSSGSSSQNVICQKTGAEQDTPRTIAVDANQESRNKDFVSCMKAKGYSKSE